MSKSRPLYQPLQLDPSGRVHLVLSDTAMLPDWVQSTSGLGNLISWIVALAAPGIPATEPQISRAFHSTADLFSHLVERLKQQQIGFRLYAMGTEAFIWDVMKIATTAGLGAGEVFLSQSGSHRRRVYCTHCKTIIENVSTNIVTCPACQASLTVRDHFSRRLAAFMGVMADAEVPGELPPVQQVYF